MFDFKEFRVKNNFTQSDAAEYFGCKQSFISLIETNRSKIPSEFITKILADPTINKSMLPQDLLAESINLSKVITELTEQNKSQQRTIENLSETINRQSKIIETLTSKID